MAENIGTAILRLGTDKKSRPLCYVTGAWISDSEQKGLSAGWLEITLSTGTIIHLSPGAVDTIVSERAKLAAQPVAG